MKVSARIERRQRTHLEIAMSAAVSAGLAANEAAARREMEEILEKHAPALKAQWLRQRGGGIKGWLCFLRTYGYQERLVVQRIRVAQAEGEGVDRRTFSEAENGHYQRVE